MGSGPVEADRSSVAASHTFSDDSLQKAAGGRTALRMPALAPGVKGEQWPVERRLPVPIPNGRVDAERGLVDERSVLSSSESAHASVGELSCPTTPPGDIRACENRAPNHHWPGCRPVPRATHCHQANRGSPTRTQIRPETNPTLPAAAPPPLTGSPQPSLPPAPPIARPSQPQSDACARRPRPARVPRSRRAWPPLSPAPAPPPPGVLPPPGAQSPGVPAAPPPPCGFGPCAPLLPPLPCAPPHGVSPRPALFSVPLARAGAPPLPRASSRAAPPPRAVRWLLLLLSARLRRRPHRARRAGRPPASGARRPPPPPCVARRPPERGRHGSRTPRPASVVPPLPARARAGRARSPGERSLPHPSAHPVRAAAPSATGTRAVSQPALAILPPHMPIPCRSAPALPGAPRHHAQSLGTTTRRQGGANGRERRGARAGRCCMCRPPAGCGWRSRPAQKRSRPSRQCQHMRVLARLESARSGWAGPAAQCHLPAHPPVASNRPRPPSQREVGTRQRAPAASYTPTNAWCGCVAPHVHHPPARRPPPCSRRPTVDARAPRAPEEWRPPQPTRPPLPPRHSAGALPRGLQVCAAAHGSARRLCAPARPPSSWPSAQHRPRTAPSPSRVQPWRHPAPARPARAREMVWRRTIQTRPSHASAPPARRAAGGAPRACARWRGHARGSDAALPPSSAARGTQAPRARGGAPLPAR
eukprot:scaffold16845_cov27-Tisochrysis_lutea.AAC.1